MSDVRRHLLALRTVMAEFGEDFELDAFRAAHSRAGARVGAARDQQLPGFYDAYRAWIKRGFLSKSSDALARARGRT